MISTPEQPASRISLPLLLVLGATVLVFASLCKHEFTWWDDFGTIHQNPAMNAPSIEALKHYWKSSELYLYIPLTYTVWLAIASVARLDQPTPDNIWLNPWFFHTANVVVHIISAVVVYCLLARLVKSRWPAALGALIFALHPVQVEPVGWISGLKDVLAGCFSMIAIWRHIKRAQIMRDEPDSWIPSPSGTIALILALLSKPSAMVVPLIALTIDWLLIARPLPRVLKSLASWFVIVIPFAIIARNVQTVVDASVIVPIWTRPFVFADAVSFYLSKLFFPVWLGVDYGRKPQGVIANTWTYVSWLIPVVIALLIWLARRLRPWLLCGGLVFILGFLPIWGLTPFLFQFTSTVADHYLYIAMLGPAIVVAYVLQQCGSKRRYAMCAMVIVMLAARSIAQTFTWQDDFSLFETAIAVNPRSALAYNNLGHAYLLIGAMEEAESHFTKAIELDPNYTTARANLDRVRRSTGKAQSVQ